MQLIHVNGPLVVSINPGDWVFLESVVASNDATVEITGLNSTYFAYKFLWTDLKPVSDTDMTFRTSTGAGFDSGASDYMWTLHSAEMVVSVPAHGTVGDEADSRIDLLQSVENANEIDLLLTLYNPSGTAETKTSLVASYFSTSSAEWFWVNGAGKRVSTEDVSAVQFLFLSGNISSGTLKVYGIEAS